MQNIVHVAHHEPILEFDVANPSKDGANRKQSNNEETNSRKQKSSCPLRSERGITRELLEQISTMNVVEAAKFLDVTRSTLKRKCREYGICR